MNKKLILLLPIICGILCGSGGIFIRIFSNFGFNNPSILAIRLIGALIIILILILIFDKKSLKINLKDIWLFIGAGIIGILGLNLCYNEAVIRIPLSLASLLLSLAPIFTLILSTILFKEKITPKKLIILAIALFGCFLVSGLIESSGFTWSTYGILCGLGSALFWTLYGVFSKLASNKGYSILTIVFYSFIIIILALTPLTNWTLLNTFIITNPSINIPILILNSLIISVIPYYLFSYSLTKIENGKATILSSSSEPLSATLFGAIFFAEYPSPLNIIGIIITLIALTLLIKENTKNLKKTNKI